MANFTTEAQVREKFQLNDTTLVPTALIETSITDAHNQVLRFLDPVFDIGSPDAGLVLGETLLAGVHLLRSIAASAAFEQKALTIGGNRVGLNKRFETLSELATETETRAWAQLEPFVMDISVNEVAEVTDTTPITGRD